MNEGTTITVIGALGIVLAAVLLISLTWYVFNGQKNQATGGVSARDEQF